MAMRYFHGWMRERSDALRFFLVSIVTRDHRAADTPQVFCEHGPWSGQIVLISSVRIFFSSACTCAPYFPDDVVIITPACGAQGGDGQSVPVNRAAGRHPPRTGSFPPLHSAAITSGQCTIGASRKRSFGANPRKAHLFRQPPAYESLRKCTPGRRTALIMVNVFAFP